MKKDFKKYKGEYEKTEYDIMLFNGKVFHNCWPNAGKFHTQDGLSIDGEQVEFFKESEKKSYA